MVYPLMIAVLDTNILIKRDIDFSKYKQLYLPESVVRELRDEETRLFYEKHVAFIEVRNPRSLTVETVKRHNAKRNLLLSDPDIDVVALFVDLSNEMFDVWISSDSSKVVCLSDDNGIKQAVCELTKHQENIKIWKFRCYACYEIYDSFREFCAKCGYNSITRVSVRKEGDKEIVNMKKGYKLKDKSVMYKKNEIRTEDQREYNFLAYERRAKANQKSKITKRSDFDLF
ncbi:hypothetical protein EDEG_02781 [Edhazardia aedis USNM 41457]|uniref:PIN domain-containing protein n=1 Tax=Edhazardia aedis (strain USNM 41457) TaxID=1003232 RepID=J9DJN9_EDHAE|nr:hypothetical protein EDEG_02781 [Edhazardia aedis USNM 41457]|eukprot:EJW02840.1 hypothetical protein EDEG_02781 [Edhazardia aedis USNM 41457]